jgi:hypothetical protein
MTNRLIRELLERLMQDATVTLTKKEIIALEAINDGQRFIDVQSLISLIRDIECKIAYENHMTEIDKKRLTPKTKFLYVEDGSVDLEELEDKLFDTNPEIQIVTYRQGSCPPSLVIYKEKDNDRQNN